MDWNGHPEIFQSNFESESEVKVKADAQADVLDNLNVESNFELSPPSFTRVEPVVESENPKALEDFSDVVNYSNSTETTGVVVYTLFISGLDSKKQIDIFTEVISDSKMGWLVEDILSQVSLGKIKIDNLNAPKLHVLIQRLKWSGLELRWEQKVL